MVHHHPAGAEAQGQLALGDVHHISDLPHLAALGTAHHLAHHRSLSGREQGCKGASNGLLHPLHIGRTTIIKSNTAGPEQSPIMVPQLLGRHAAGGLGIPQLVHRIGLLGAHLLYQPEDGPAPLVVDPGSNAVGQIGPLAGHKILGKHPVLRVRVQQNFTHQGKGRLQHCHTVQGIVIVNKAALESHALALSPLTDRRAQGCAVELVRGSGQTLHIGMVPTAPVQDVGNQSVGRGGVRPQGHRQRHAEYTGFELVGSCHDQLYPVSQGFVESLHTVPPSGNFSTHIIHHFLHLSTIKTATPPSTRFIAAKSPTASWSAHDFCCICPGVWKVFFLDSPRWLWYSIHCKVRLLYNPRSRRCSP